MASDQVAAALRDSEGIVAPPGPIPIVAEEDPVIGSEG